MRNPTYFCSSIYFSLIKKNVEKEASLPVTDESSGGDAGARDGEWRIECEVVIG